ncbi:NUDIX hydrolase [Propionicimonas sp.]|uniref:NUDIX domain-containing protein n=1 Tax=Propionicimonas sp. TaxID=1955623 RepID=UPI0025CD3ECA|nr:NUDIX hydrolase [Propionicimonas sp.]MCG2806178.1 NUDIX hydrolase [Propionicimonas sp.]
MEAELMIRLLAPDEIGDRSQLWPLIEHAVLASGNVCDFVVDTVRTPDGGSMTRQYTLHPGAVGVIAWDEADRIAVVLQYRHPVAHQLVEPPAGLLDQGGEDYLAAAQRELAEEAGLAAADWRVLVDMFTTPGANQESVRIYLARGLSPAPVPAGFVAESEEAAMEVAWAARADLVAAVLAGRLQNPVMVAGVLALEVARLGDGLDVLRPAEADWPARRAWEAQNRELKDAANPG